MIWGDICTGATVYHTLMTHWGKGIVKEVVLVDALERVFERGTRRILVDFKHRPLTVRLTLRELRKTPNRRKIRDMVKFYQGRGVDAKDGGDRLILPSRTRKE